MQRIRQKEEAEKKEKQKKDKEEKKKQKAKKKEPTGEVNPTEEEQEKDSKVPFTKDALIRYLSTMLKFLYNAYDPTKERNLEYQFPGLGNPFISDLKPTHQQVLQNSIEAFFLFVHDELPPSLSGLFPNFELPTSFYFADDEH
jgi:hypothetical protein